VIDLDQNLSCGQQIFDPRPTPNDEVLEERVAAITTGDPDNSRRRSAALLDLNKIAVFGDDYRVHLASLLENLRILCPEETKVLNMDGLALVKVP